MWTASHYSSPPENNLNQPNLLTIIWLRKYPYVGTFSLWFDIDPSSVVRIVCKALPELCRYRNFAATNKTVGPSSLKGEILWEIGKNFLMRWEQ